MRSSRFLTLALVPHPLARGVRGEGEQLDLRVRQTKANFAPKIKPFGVSFTFEARTLTDIEMMEEERVPVREVILAALLVESRTVPELVGLTGAS